MHAVCMYMYAGQKGGALVSTLYHYSEHGDPAIHTLVKHILTQVRKCVCMNLPLQIYF